MTVPLAILAVVVLFVAAFFAAVRGVFVGARRIEGVTVRTPTDDTRIDADGAVRSIQGADIVLPEQMLGELWSTQTLERLARTYWAFLSAVTLGLIRVYYTEGERYVSLLFKPLKLLTFQAPEYETDADRGIVRWRIEKGLLVAERGQGGDGYLEIDVTKRPSDEPGCAVVHAEVEVANFYPAIASGITTWVYKNTQSRIHVIVTHGVLRSLARMDFAESRVGRFKVPAVEDTPSPQRQRVS